MTTRTGRYKMQLLWENGKRCAICGKRIRNFDELTLDHIVPLAKGGQNVIENCQLAHAKCNVMKGDIMPDTFAWTLKRNRRRSLMMKLKRAVMLW